jgi:FtsX-like permease family
MRLRSELRSRWRAWLGLAVLIGVAGGATAEAAAGARRTETAYPRFVQAQNGYQLVVRGFPEGINPERSIARIAAMPEVAQWARIDAVGVLAVLPSGRLVPPQELAATTDLMGQAGFRLNRFKVISGRMASPRASGEAVIDFGTADREDLRVGSIVRFIGAAADGTPRRFGAVRIVGVVASPGQFPAVGASSSFGRIYLTPAFVRSNGIRPSPADSWLLIRLRHGPADFAAFLRHLDAAGLGGVDVPYVQQTQTAATQRSIRVESQALWVLAAFIALAALAIFGQALARQTYLDSAELETLSALGLSRGQLAWLGVMRAGVIGVAAACLVAPVAVLLSPLTPVGLARIAEPDPGFAVDGATLILGTISVLVLTIAASAIPAWTAARTAATRAGSSGPGRERPSALTAALSRAWRSPAAAAGIRMAFQPGRGPTAVPVRSTVFGATLSVAALAASLVFASSFGHLLGTPRLSGFTWDAYVAVDGQQAKAAAALRADPKIAGYARGGFIPVRIGDLKLTAVVLSGPAGHVITDGTAPAAGNEVALGAATMRAAHTATGQSVNLVLDQADRHPKPKPVRMRVTGTAIVPPNPFQTTGLGEGAALTVPGLARIDPGATGQLSGLPFLVSFAPGVSRDAGLAAIINDIKGFANPFIVAAERPANVVSLASMAGVPVALSVLLALIAAGTLAHTLASSTRRRRHDLAILKSLGFLRRQVRHAVGWQATTIAATALLIGLPTGIAGGRWAWRLFAAQLGVLPEPAIPLTAILIAIPAALALANLIAAAPARAAARTRPATILRTE